MKNSILFLCCFLASVNFLYSQKTPLVLPDSIFTGSQGKFHVQGVAVDSTNACVYFSFTNSLVKMDFTGQLIGSVVGFSGHLGDLDFRDGKVYGSLEYKSDVIGRGISKELGQIISNENGFYIAVFDGSKIVRPNMNAEKEDLLKTIYLAEPTIDYEATVKLGNEEKQHRYACSGIDGVAFGPAFGDPKGTKNYLYVAYGVYGDTTRNDNDHQVLLQYDIENWDQYGQPLSISKLHRSGPKKPNAKYFLKTGSTTFGIQNLAYDDYSGNFYAAVYKGKKSIYPNYSLFVIDVQQKPTKKYIESNNTQERVAMLQLADGGLRDLKSAISGWNFEWGATGLCPLGNGYFYISHPKKTKDGQQQSTLHKYKWTGDKDTPFKRSYLN